MPCASGFFPPRLFFVSAMKTTGTLSALLLSAAMVYSAPSHVEEHEYHSDHNHGGEQMPLG